MNETKKPIKYIAIAIAVLIIFTIISGIIFILKIAVNTFDEKPSENLKGTEINNNITSLNIDLLTTKLIIKRGEKFTFETNNEHINSNKGSDKLYIKEETHNILFKNTNYELIVYIPENTKFEEVYIETKAGSINIDKLTTNILELDLGAGNVVIDELNTLNKTTIDGGAGEITIQHADIKNLDLDMGVGKVNLNTILKGNNKIDAGVGQLNINLLGENYAISVEKGIGSTTINNEKIKEDIILGTGDTNIEINGGIGSINITTKENLTIESETQFEMTVDKYLKNEANEIIIIGTVISGTTNYNENVQLLDENNNILATLKISNKNPELYETTIENAKPKDKVSIIIADASEEIIKNTKKIVNN